MSPVKLVIAMHASSVPKLPHFPEADDCGGCLIGTDHRTQDCAVKLLDEYRGVDAVTEPHGELTPFSLRGAVGSSAGSTAGDDAISTRQEASRARVPRGGWTTARILPRGGFRPASGRRGDRPDRRFPAPKLTCQRRRLPAWLSKYGPLRLLLRRAVLAPTPRQNLSGGWEVAR